ncbi:MAG: NAD(P)H-dependent flavin oxidoreductase [Alphaproteobacteria bacterium]
MKKLDSIVISGKESLPLIEGGKGIAVSSGESSGAWAKAGGVGTFSGVNADSYDENGKLIPQIYKEKTRKGRHRELVDFSVSGAIEQAQIARDIAGPTAPIHINILWEMAAAEEILTRTLEKAGNIIDGVTCGAGMPYRLSEIAAKYGIFYYPIVSSARAFNALWKRSYRKTSKFLGGVVYEDPWLAGGHNGLSNSENPLSPEPPYPRVKALRSLMNDFNLQEIPIIMAGGVWNLSEWEHWIDNPEIGKIAFQFGTRPLLTKESPIPDEWKQKLLTIKKGEVSLHRFSPTGFYSSAVKNDFLKELQERSERQTPFLKEQTNEFNEKIEIGPRKRAFYVKHSDKSKIVDWIRNGFSKPMTTPNDTLIWVTIKKASQIVKDQIDCMGCLSQCLFSNWSQDATGTTGKKADPRSFCIQKTLQKISHGISSLENELMFAGHSVYRFALDPFYKGGFIPKVNQLVDRIVKGL